MARMAKKKVWAEMARRKVKFHPNENWYDITLWGLFQWGAVSHLLESGELVTHMSKQNKTIWVHPSDEVYHKHIEPLIEKHTLDELTAMAGWDVRPSGALTPMRA